MKQDGAVGSQVREWPFATREDCWRALRPGRPFSASGFQRLRTQGLVSPGVRVSPRRGGQALGQERAFSRLNLLALSAHRSGDLQEWARLLDLAVNVERDSRMQELAEAVVRAPGRGPAPTLSELSGRVRELVAAVCELTDRWQRQLPGEHGRFPAVVERLHGGVADLVLDVGGRCTFSQVKLAGIGRGSVGDAVYLYLVDMGGPDELVRARPAVVIAGGGSVGAAGTTGTTAPVAPGPFERHVTEVTGAPLEALNRLVAFGDRGPLPDLSGLHWSSDD